MATSLGQIDLEKMPRSERDKLAKLLTPKLTKYIPHTPMPKQAAFMLLDSKEAFYGGAAGGGKSDCLLMCGLQYVDVKGFSGILFRKTFADLVKPGALIDRAKDWLAPFMQSGEVRWVEKDKKFEFLESYGRHKDIKSVLQFGYLETDNDRYNYQGGEYQFIGFDELTHISEVNYKYLFSRLRRLKGVEIPLRVRGAANPPDDGQGEWVYHRFVDPKTKKKGAIFIPAGLDDNPFLDKESYVESLEELDPVTRARLRDGIWTMTRKGNMFKREWFQPVTELPRHRKRLRYWDLAASELTPRQKKRNADPDYSVGFLLSEYDGVYYIEDIEHRRGTPYDIEQTVSRLASQDGYSTTIAMEEEPGSSGKNNSDNYARKVLKGYDFRTVRVTDDKVTRANPASAAAEHGLVKYLAGCRNIEEFFDEIEGFPGAPHDDYVDGFSGAFNLISSSIKNISTPICVCEEGATSYWESSDISDTVNGAYGWSSDDYVGSYWHNA